MAVDDADVLDRPDADALCDALNRADVIVPLGDQPRCLRAEAELAADLAVRRRQPSMQPRFGKTKRSISLAKQRALTSACTGRSTSCPGTHRQSAGMAGTGGKRPGEVELHAEAFEVGKFVLDDVRSTWRPREPRRFYQA